MLGVGVLFVAVTIVFNGLTVDAGHIRPTSWAPWGHGKKCAYADVLMLYDDSVSLGTYFKQMKAFMINVVRFFCNIGIEGTQFGSACFERTVKKHFHLNEHMTENAIVQAINAFNPRFGGATNIKAALQWAKDIGFASANSNGLARQGAAEIVIVISDGRYNAGGNPVQMAAALKMTGAYIISVAVGNANVPVLKQISSDNFVFEISSDPNAPTGFLNTAPWVARLVYQYAQSGPRGPPGPPGLPGPPGQPGSKGPNGPNGDAGETGQPGDEGDQGKRGETGEKGSRGSKGPRGMKGQKGQPGPNGETGPAGDVGPRGAPGSPGTNGANGKPGEQGKQGDVGPKGYKGDKGPRGPAGSNGEKGPVGPPGDQGPPGDPGRQLPKGPKGPRGPPGPKGEPAPTQPPPPQPPTGDPGPPGPKGYPGSPGKTTLIFVPKKPKYGYPAYK